MKSVTNIFSSMTTAVFLLIIYIISAAVATFIENDFGTEAAAWLVYKSSWFNTLHILLVMTMISVIIKYKMYSIKKISSFVFHLGLVITVLGAGITRFTGYEGIMHIRMNQTSNKIVTYPTFLFVDIKHKNLLYHSEIPVKFNVLRKNNLQEDIDFEGKKFKLQVVDFVPNAAEQIIQDKKGTTIIAFKIADNSNSRDFYIKKGESKIFNELKISFDDGVDESALNILDTDTGVIFTCPYPVFYQKMNDTIYGTVSPGEIAKFEKQMLYSFAGYNIVLKNVYTNAKTKLVQKKNKNLYPLNGVSINISDNETAKQIYVLGKSTIKGEKVNFSIDDYEFSVSYGSKEIELPFSLTLNKFVLKRYPGSMSPSSYESFVTLNDSIAGIKKDYKIFMNNVLNYKGYRFFQSSYDPDERGTVLSVNKDNAGTFVTYIGYILLALGMFLILFNKHSRYRFLARKLKELQKTKFIIIVAIFSGIGAYSQNNLPQINYKHADKFGHLLVQTNSGRLEPINTLSNELLRKLSKRSTYKDMNSDQVFLSLMLSPENWAKEPLIKITHPELIKMFDAKNKHISFVDLFDENNHYKIQQMVNTAYEKDFSRRNMLDKDIIKLDEKVNILYQWLNGDFLVIFPKPNDPNHKWYSLNNADKVFSGQDSVFIFNVFRLYYNDLQNAAETNDWKKADSSLSFIAMYQQKVAKDIMPEKSKVEAEIFYNKTSIFRHLFEFYFIIGLVYLLYLFIKILKPKSKTKWLDYIFFTLILIAFVFHNFGLILRWYISGHAPWSNGYESMIYISWATMLAGFIYYKNSKISLAATTVLSGIILLVAHLSWIDPQITNLVPVLKSYWLTIHVSVITASYGFLALGALLGFINLLLMIFKTENNKSNIDLNIKKLTYINEMSLILGLLLLTIGTFLGGVWANESWGRYWGWDPKETWALISMLVYAVVIHARFVPGLRGVFAFNLMSLLAISSVIMTYFGVNFYLSGLHSYASGDPVPIPVFVYYTLAVILIIGITAYFKNKKY